MAELKVYTIEEVVDILHVTRRSVYSYIKSGKLKAVKIGKYWRITQENLEEFLTTGTGKKHTTKIYNPEEWSERDRKFLDSLLDLKPEDVTFLAKLMGAAEGDKSLQDYALSVASKYRLSTDEGKQALLSAVQSAKES